MNIDRIFLFFFRPSSKSRKKEILYYLKSFYSPLYISFILLIVFSSCLKNDASASQLKDNANLDEKVECGEWNIAVHSWIGSRASATVFAEVARAEYGCTIHLIPYEDEYETTYNALEKGELDFVIEDWGNGRWSPWTEKNAFKQVGSNGQEGRIGMYLPQWMADLYPDITIASNLNKYTALFTTEQSNPLGAWHEGPKEWTTIGTKLIQANQLNYKLINSIDEKELINAFINADKNQTAFLGYWWTPHFLNAQLSLARVNFPENDWSTTEEASGITDYPAIILMKLASNRLMESQSDLLNLVKNFQWSNEDQNRVAAAIENGSTPTEAAKNWIESNREKVDIWLKTDD